MISAQAECSPVGTSENNLLFNTYHGFSARHLKMIIESSLTLNITRWLPQPKTKRNGLLFGDNIFTSKSLVFFAMTAVLCI